jgi:hypothetical protein
MGKRETSRGFSSTQANNQVVTNNNSEVTVFSQVIPAGKMGSSKKLSLSLLATLTTPLLSIPSITVRVKLGNAVLTVINNVGLVASQNNAPFTLDATIRNKDDPAIQIAYAKMIQNASNGTLLNSNATATYADWTVDTTVDQTLSVTVQFGALSSNTNFTLRDVDLDLS